MLVASLDIKSPENSLFFRGRTKVGDVLQVNARLLAFLTALKRFMGLDFERRRRYLIMCIEFNTFMGFKSFQGFELSKESGRGMLLLFTRYFAGLMGAASLNFSRRSVHRPHILMGISPIYSRIPQLRHESGRKKDVAIPHPVYQGSIIHRFFCLFNQSSILNCSSDHVKGLLY